MEPFHHRNESPLRVMLIWPDFNRTAVYFDTKETEHLSPQFQGVFVGQPLQSAWKKLRCWRANPLLPRTDYFGLVPGAFGIWPATESKLESILASSVELLPVYVEDSGPAAIANITVIATDAFDAQKGQRRLLAGQWLMEPTKYAFRPNIVRTLSLFRIPEYLSAMFCATGGDTDPALDFYAHYQAHNSTGLSFECVWMDE